MNIGDSEGIAEGRIIMPRLLLKMMALLSAYASCELDKTVTMYHVNPTRFGPIPRDMDTADAVGDILYAPAPPHNARRPVGISLLCVPSQL